MIFQGLLVVSDCAFNYTGIKRGLSHNFAKNVKGHHFMGQSSMGLKFSITTEF